MREIDINVTTSSNTIVWPWPNAPYDVPNVVVNGETVVPGTQPNSPTGCRQLIYDMKLFLSEGKTTPLIDKFIPIYSSEQDDSEWWNTYSHMWDNLVTNYLITGDPEHYLMVLATYGLDYNMAPTNGALEMLLKMGAGNAVQEWASNCDPGSQMGNDNYWTATPGNYILIGISGRSFGKAPGEIQERGEFGNEKTTELSVSLCL